MTTTKFSCFLVALLIFINLFGLVQKNIWQVKYDPLFWQTKYEASNWQLGWAIASADQVLGDADLYAYAGYRQIQGADPTLINPEMPPLGKYFLGLSILIFGNPLAISFLWAVLVQVVLYRLGRLLALSPSLSLVGVALFALDKLVQENLGVAMLDLPFTFFITTALYFLLKSQAQPKYYLAVLGCLGAVSAIKMYLVGFGLVAVVLGLTLVFCFMTKTLSHLKWFGLGLFAFGLVYLGSYSVYFLTHTLADFKYLHFWIRHFARVQVAGYPGFEIFRILLLGQWRTWWGSSGIVPVSAWTVLWPLGTLALVITTFQSFLKKNYQLLILTVWFFALLAMFSYGIPYPRYLLPVLPILSLSLIYFFHQAYHHYVDKH